MSKMSPGVRGDNGKKGQERMRRMNNKLETDAMKKMETMEICLLLEEKAEVITI